MKIKLTADMRMRLAYAEELDITDIVAPIIAERNELAATVEVLRGSLKALSFEAQICGGIAGRNESLISAVDFAHRVLTATPQQHLRDVRAEAGRAGFIAGAKIVSDSCINAEDEWRDSQIASEADNYAESVKAGEK